MPRLLVAHLLRTALTEMSETPILSSELSYLQPIVDRLTELSDDEINENLDTSFIDQAVRDRFATYDPLTAEEEFEQHYRLLRLQCDELTDERAILPYLEGYLSSFLYNPEMLISPPEPPPKTGRRVVLDDAAAKGFDIEQLNESQLVMRRGDLCIVIDSLDEISFKTLTVNRDRWYMPDDSLCVFNRNVEMVRLGPVSGTRDLYVQTSPSYWKQVRYLLTVPGGLISVDACAGSKEDNDFGKDFDIADFEGILESIHVIHAV